MSQILRQKTLKSAISCNGVGLHTGAKVTLALTPTDEGTGIVFKRTDIAGGQSLIPAHWRNVTESQLCTAIANGDGVSVSTIEHLMAALAAAGIDNAIVEINGPEVPIMDGSAAPFTFLIECAGVAEQAAPKQAVVVKKPISIKIDKKEVSIAPGAGFSIAFDIDFNSAAVRHQRYHFDLTNGGFKADIARARTFGFEHEINAMRAQGLLPGGSLDNAVVVSGDKVLNESGLRYDDEFVRHKVLDCVGDLYLAGAPLIGHFHGSRSGHRMNWQLLQALFADASAYQIQPFDTDLLQEIPQPERPLIAGAASRRVAAAASL